MDIDNTFRYHAPTPDQVDRYQEIREAAKVFARVVDRCTPASREKSLALTHLQTAVMFANASIAITESASKVE